MRCCRAPLRRSMHISSKAFNNIIDLAKDFDNLVNLPDGSIFQALFHVSINVSACHVGLELSQKYGLAMDNTQVVVSVTNKQTGEQTWFNEVRTRKPQTFTQEANIHDPTDGGRKCDFCLWQTYTATDTFGRIELEHAVTASNLFKYCEPSHGVVLFKHHNPLHFTLPQLRDLLMAGHLWLAKAHAAHPHAKYPFFLWNCLPRAGASQFHGHAQVMLSAVPLPAQLKLDLQAGRGAAAAASHERDLLRAHRAVGLMRACSREGRRAWAFASVTPVKDMEVMVVGGGLDCPAFCRMLHAALRALVDTLGCATFNVGVLNLRPDAPERDVEGARPIIAKIVSRGKLSSAASDYGGLEVVGGASIGHTDPYLVIAAVSAQLGDDAIDPADAL